MSHFDVTRMHYVGTDMLTRFVENTVDAMNDKTYELYLQYHLAICERDDLGGATNHMLDIFRKEWYIMVQPIIDISSTVLTTDRLILRPFCEKDLNDFYMYASVPGVGELAGWPHHTSIEVSQRILNSFIEEKEVFALVHKATGKVIGSLGIHAGNDEVNTPRVREIGYVLSREFWGQGLMPEAVHEVIRYCFEDVGLEALTVGHFVSNTQSRRVIEKCGFRYLKNKQYHADQLSGQMLDECFYILTHEKWCLQKESIHKVGC